MKFNNIFILILITVCLLSFATVNAADLDNVGNFTEIDEVISANSDDVGCVGLNGSNSYYVDNDHGDDTNDGKSMNSAVKTLKKALGEANDYDTIYLSDGVYSGSENNKITIDKSVSIIGSENTNFDGSYENYLFLILDDVTVNFKNIKFINGFKTELDSDLIDDYEFEGIYGGALDIKNSKVTLENCYFKYNMANYDYSSNDYVYGGAISNFGDLTICNTYFDGNAVGATTDIYGYGGAIYNKGKMSINGSFFNDSRGNTYSYGGAIYNDGVMIINNSVITNSYCWEESKGSAIFNNGHLTLLNSIIENNTIERTDFNYIYGNIFNSGKLIATGNIFRNNTANYKQPNSQYIGTPTIYNVGDLELSYNAFMDNVDFNGIYTDISLNGGNSVNIDNNWWNTNENPFNSNKVNFNKLNSWIVLDLNPDYSSLKINESVKINVGWKLSNGQTFDLKLFPSFNVTVMDLKNDKKIISDQPLNDNLSFIFNNSQEKGVYKIRAIVNSFYVDATVDVGKSNTFIKLHTNVSEGYFFDSIGVNISLGSENLDNIDGEVILELNNRFYTVNIKNNQGYYVFSNLTPQNYKLKVKYNGNSQFSKSSNETEFIIKKYPVRLDILPIEDINTIDNVNLSVNLTGHDEGLFAHLYVNGVYKQPIYLNNGITTFNLNYFAKGRYNLTVIVPENSNYCSANASVFFNVEISSVSLNVSCRDIYAGEPAVITVESNQENFNGEAILSINGINNTVYLKNKSTNITVSQLTNGTYNVRVIFEGNDRFTKANASASFNVYKKQSSLNVSIEKNNLTGVIIVRTNSPKCGGSVGLYVNQRYYVKNLVNGVATFDVEFDKGTNYIYSFYNGDFTYEPSNWNTTIGNAENYFMTSENITFYEHNDFNYTVGLYEENGIAMPNQIVSVSFENKTYNLTTDSQGIANFKLNLKNGEYLISASYKNVTVYNTILIKPIEFTVSAKNVTYGQIVSVAAEFKDNISGNVVFELSDRTVVVNIINLEAVCTIAGLNAGSYLVNAYYSNEFFNSTKCNTSFCVNRADSKFNVEFSDFEVNSPGNITVTFLNNETGKVEFSLDGDEYVMGINNSLAVLKLMGLSAGYHNLKINYSGDNNYNNSTFDMKLPVKSFLTDLELIIENSTFYGEELKIIAKVIENATGYVEFEIANQSKICEIDNGLAIWNISNIDVGTYKITAIYKSNSLFRNQKNETYFNILRANSTIELYANNVCIGENIKINAKLSPGATGNVTYSMLGYYSPRVKIINNHTSYWLISPLKYGAYTVTATYNGDKNYCPSNTTFILNVTQRKSILKVDVDDVTKNEKVVVNVKLTADNGKTIDGTVMVNIKGFSYEVIVIKGHGTLILDKFAIGSYKFDAEFEGNENYSRCIDDGSFKVFDSQISTQLYCTNLTKYVGGNKKLDVILSQEDGKAISNVKIHIRLNNKDYDLVTDGDGKVSLGIDFPKGAYDAKISFDGTERYYSSQINVTVNVLSTIESANLKKLFGTESQYFAIFRDFNGKALANTPVTFKIGSKSYKFNTAVNGVVRVNINLNVGKYSITAINPVTGEKKVNTIIIFKKLMENKNVINYFGAKSVYKVRAYGDNGKPLGAGNLVIFKIDGKTYKVKTDKKGYAKLSLKLKPKLYTISAQFNRTKVSNKILVKPVLTTKITSNKKTKKTKFTAKLVNTKGKPLKGKKITFKINGKKYTAKTNKKGIASINIKLKLKKGNYKIYTIYGKSKVTDKIRVK